MRKLAILPACLTSLLTLGAAGTRQEQKIHYADLNAGLREILSKQGVVASRFGRFILSIDERTTERERAGENDHLIYFVLQSSVFTHQPRIEPAVSAGEFVNSLAVGERDQYLEPQTSYIPPVSKISKSVIRRIADFVQAVNGPTSDERLDYFKVFLKNSRISTDQLTRFLWREYARSMRFLYLKEFAGKDANPSTKGEVLASLYQNRGHSTDTRLEANFAIWTALSVLKALNPGLQINRVLIVGPGLDFSPRTSLIESLGPQSYQPFAVADALLGLGFSTEERLMIHCVDINKRVVRYLKEFPRREIRSITVPSGLPDASADFLTSDLKSYFEDFGKRIGTQRLHVVGPASPDGYGMNRVLVRKELAEKITAERMNIATERYRPSPEYDLVVATNVFLYFNTPELLLSLSNIHSMMKEGGWLIHNEFRPELETLAKAAQLPALQARTVRLTKGDDRALLDGFVIHQKERERSPVKQSKPISRGLITK